MKMKLALVINVLLVMSSAKVFGMACSLRDAPTRSYDDCVDNGNWANGPASVPYYCAPEVQQSNISTTEAVLTSLSQQELKEATTFKVLVAKAQVLPSDKKMSAYLSMIGVHTDADLAEFVGARQIDEKYISSLSKNADLTRDQSVLVLGKVSASLLGERK
jgi:hypothetical protein